MKCAFLTSHEIATQEIDDDDDDDDDDDIEIDNEDLEECTPYELKYDGWLGCTAHQLQLVVHDGYTELTSYRRVKAAFIAKQKVSVLSLTSQAT
uniref:Uncharacterized protein n=1 Tax=Amphimedon queenslandica TaxID=400682 RepID=A0A1X7UB36_AMPQE